MQTLNAAGPHVIVMVVAWFATHSFEMNRPVVAWPSRVPQLGVGALRGVDGHTGGYYM